MSKVDIDGLVDLIDELLLYEESLLSALEPVVYNDDDQVAKGAALVLLNIRRAAEYLEDAQSDLDDLEFDGDLEDSWDGGIEDNV